MNRQKPQDAFIKTFEYYLQKSIGVVAVMRLAADPFPILLMDEEILLRCFDSMTEAYSQDFVDEYIGEQTVEEYKETSMYEGTYNAFINDEKKNYATFNVMKYNIIDRNEMSDILSQIHLLNDDDVISVLIANSCEKIAKIYAHNGMLMYFTEKETARTAHSWSGFDFIKFAENEIQHNQPYDEAFISVFYCLNETYYAEHNETLTDEEIQTIINTLNKHEQIKKES